MQDFIHRCGRQGGGIGEAFHEPLEIAKNGRNLGLLQHDLGHPHPVRRAVLLPGQIMAAVSLIAQKSTPTDADIDETMTNICRCGTYPRIRAAVHRAAELAKI